MLRDVARTARAVRPSHGHGSVLARRHAAAGATTRGAPSSASAIGSAALRICSRLVGRGGVRAPLGSRGYVCSTASSHQPRFGVGFKRSAYYMIAVRRDARDNRAAPAGAGLTATKYGGGVMHMKLWVRDGGQSAYVGSARFCRLSSRRCAAVPASARVRVWRVFACPASLSRRSADPHP